MEDYILKAIRGNDGLELNDTSKDEIYKSWSSEKKLAYICGWELGDRSWAKTFLSWAEDCGFEIKENGAKK